MTCKEFIYTYDEPADIAMVICKLMCLPKAMSLILKLGLAFGWDIVTIMKFQMDVYPDMGLYIFIPVGVCIFCFAILVLMGMYTLSHPEFLRTFFLSYKVFSVVMAIICATAIVIEREKLDFTNWEHIVFVTVTAADVILDPIELIFFGCCISKSDIYTD